MDLAAVKYEWSPYRKRMLGRMPDSEVAKRLGIAISTVHAARKRFRIQAYRHRRDDARKPEARNCLRCDKGFKAGHASIVRGEGKYCSRKCARLDHVHRFNIAGEIFTYAEIAAAVGLSETTVRNRHYLGWSLAEILITPKGKIRSTQK